MCYTLGFDFGTSGARAIALNGHGNICFSDRYPFPASIDNYPQLWCSALFRLLERLPTEIASSLGAIAINGTSGTILLCDQAGNPQSPVILYNDPCRPSDGFLSRQGFIPPLPPTLLKLLWWAEQSGWNQPPTQLILLHQADWLAAQLLGRYEFSDYHNALKLGYDPGLLHYLPSVQASVWAKLLPQVLAPGTAIGLLTPAIAQRFGLNPTCQICAGTTDSIAAFLAAGVSQPGEAVTSLGSTLVLKLLSRTRVDEPRYGIYSHRLHPQGDLWLVGGASNTGGAVLRAFFSDDQLRSLSGYINPNQPSPLDYYPLLQPGDRFPIADPELPPRLSPRPPSDADFLHGLLEGIARIEALGYQRLQELGATPLTQVWSAGGGAYNPTWSAIRQRCLGVPVAIAPQTEAAFGTARLALTQLALI